MVWEKINESKYFCVLNNIKYYNLLFCKWKKCLFKE